MGNLLDFIIGRLKEKSTWVGLATLVTTLGFPAVGAVLGTVGTVVATIFGASLLTLATKPQTPVLSLKS